MSFATPMVLSGPLRRPRQMLAEQEYGGHTSIHDDATAERLGLRAGPIEGPTHFSLFPPLLAQIWGRAWFERGCISAHYQNMVVEGEAVRAFAEVPLAGAAKTRVWAEKEDGTPVLEASASLGPDDGETLLEARMAALRPPERLLILADLRVGMTGAADEPVRMDAGQHMGALYPFSLAQKLEVITETSPWYSDAAASPWGRPIIPLEMISVLAEYSSGSARFPVKGPAVGLFADQEIRAGRRAAVRRRGLPDPPRDRCAGREPAHRVLLGALAHLRCGRRHAEGGDAAQPRDAEGLLRRLPGAGGGRGLRRPPRSP